MKSSRIFEDMDLRNKPSIDAGRLWERHRDLARIGATAGGGVNRQALSPEDGAARNLVLRWSAERGYEAQLDPIGNLFVRRRGIREELSAVMTGSHLDTQPTGGNYDGVYGVLCGLEAMEALDDAGVSTERSIELVVWMNEEGSRFRPTTMGSAVSAGQLQLAEMLRVRDRAGVTVEKALAEHLALLPRLEHRALGTRGYAYVEAHIEQGPVLENAGMRIGIVEAIQGLYAYEVEVTGFEAHAGTTPNRGRRDALIAAMSLIENLRQLLVDEEDQVRFTVGRLEVLPGSPNTVPGKVLFSIDLRHPDEKRLKRMDERILAACEGTVEGCVIRCRQVLASGPVHFDQGVLKILQHATRSRGEHFLRMVSGATHDAKYVAANTPSAMLFIPCAGGISHNEQESITQADAGIGAQILCDVLLDLAIQAEAGQSNSPRSRVPAD